MEDPTNEDNLPVDHSFIVLEQDPDNTMIFDISRPRRSQHNVPRVLYTDQPFNYELFEGKKDLLVGANEVLHGGRLWFGVGTPTFGKHNIAA